MTWNQSMEILSSDVWNKDADNATTLPKDAVALCAYRLLVQGILDMDEIAYIHSTPSGDELWMIAEETPDEDTESGSVDEKTDLDTLFQGQSKQAMRVLIMNHTDSVFRSSMFLLSQYFDAVCGFYSPVKFLTEGLLFRHDYEAINQRQNDTIRKNQTSARKRVTKIIKVATQLDLHPQAPLLNREIWSAQCPGTGHQLYINARKNEFGCGYCGVKGDHEQLREFAKTRKK